MSSLQTIEFVPAGTKRVKGQGWQPYGSYRALGFEVLASEDPDVIATPMQTAKRFAVGDTGAWAQVPAPGLYGGPSLRRGLSLGTDRGPYVVKQPHFRLSRASRQVLVCESDEVLLRAQALGRGVGVFDRKHALVFLSRGQDPHVARDVDLHTLLICLVLLHTDLLKKATLWRLFGWL